ncbi:Zinc finger and BTB domain-containing protein 48 [Zootermopsis nevadensis]|uniref:Zinc finger and BTB domain-containing protein 48 n=3 Tax=Zootermopsis nevadensis TaxID=136037 RepID=A0A067QY53_ZOONE|nr:Zinc finger and BTB domain-containing protein 48 [Zootermopsis nevadensis]
MVSLNSDNVQNVNASTSPQHDSVRTCQEDCSQENGNKQCRVLENDPNSRQMALVKEMESCVQDTRHSSDVNNAVYIETNATGALKSNNERTSGSYTHKLNQKDSSGIQLKVTHYPLEKNSWNENQCEEWTTNKLNTCSTVCRETNGTDVFHCDACGKRFLNKRRLITHIEKHSNPVLKCTYCPYTTKSAKLLNYHQNIHAEKFKCKVCNKLFTRKIYLTYHLKDVHCKTRYLRKCEECCARFISISGLKMHMQTVHEPLRTYSCTLCKYVGNSTNHLASHMLRIHKKKYECKICDYNSLTQGGLDKHVRIYHDLHDRQFACKHCSYRGLKRRQLLDHERIVHNQDKNKHACPVCKKAFRTRVLMKHHLPCHSDQHFYSCRGCSYTTRYRQTLHLHIKNSHPRQSFKNLCNGPSEADFEAIINTALKTMETFSSSDENNIEIDYVAQVPQDCPVVEDGESTVDISIVSEHSESHGITCASHGITTCQQNHPMTLSEYDSELTETEPSTKHMESALVIEGIMNSTLELNTGSSESDQAVTIIDSSGLTSDEVQTIVGLAGDLHGGKQKVRHLVKLDGLGTEKTLFQISGFNSENSKIHQVVTLVNSHDSITEADQHTVRSLSNVMDQKSREHPTVTHVSLTGRSDRSQENLVILPLGGAKVALIQNDNFSNSRDMFNEQTALSDLVPEQSELIQQQSENSVKQVRVYHLQ